MVTTVDMTSESGWERLGLMQDLRDQIAAGTIDWIDGKPRTSSDFPAHLIALMLRHRDVVEYVFSESGPIGPDSGHHDVLADLEDRGRRTGHALAPCNECGQVSMVAILKPDGKPRKPWPTCRMTPGCPGRHRPADDQLDGISPEPPLPQARPPSKRKRTHLIPELPPWRLQ